MTEPRGASGDAAPTTRRELLLGAAAAAAASLAARAPALSPEPPKARVVLVRRREVLDAKGNVDGAVLKEMLDEGVAALLGAPDAVAAWRRLVSPSDVVGIKTNAWRYLPTPPALEDALRISVVRAGVKPENVAVDDRGVRENPVFRRATALLNVRPMRTHHWSGLGTCLKNVIMFSESPSDYHADACAPLGALWDLPEVKGKVRLNVLVLLTPQFHGVGPHGFAAEYTWPYRGLLLGTQPVPVDATGARILIAQRRKHFGDERPMKPSPHHIEIAGTRYGLGPSDPARIDLVRLGWTDEALI